jgi:penicillin-insensitive murein endopeptidase
MIAVLLVLLPAIASAAPIKMLAAQTADILPDPEVPDTPDVGFAPGLEEQDEPPTDIEPATQGSLSPEALLERAVELSAGAALAEPAEQEVLSNEKHEPCLSVGSTSWGRLINPSRLPELPGIHVRSDSNFGTPETVAAIVYAVQKVHATYGETPPLIVGDISRERGGRFRPHKSHQAGRDADIGYFLKGEEPDKLEVATAKNLDRARTWTFIEALLEDDKVEYIFIDRRIQHLLYDYALHEAKVPQERLDSLFSIASGPRAHAGVIRHVRGHVSHLHVRFRSPIAVAAARDPANQEIIAQAKASPELMTVRVAFKIKKGDTLARIAKRYKCSVKDLMRWNGLRKATALRPGQTLHVLRERELEAAPTGARVPGT